MFRPQIKYAFKYLHIQNACIGNIELLIYFRPNNNNKFDIRNLDGIVVFVQLITFQPIQLYIGSFFS